ncbi:MAG: fused DSP-PTPase phosphatase/NAD kinase-like protein [Vicinamibacterales bacterium]
MRALTTLVAMALAVPVLAQTKQERAGIVNFTQVDAVVACGGATETSALDGLRKDGFKTVINLRMPTELGANIEQNTTYAKEIGLNYISIPFNAQSPDSRAVDTFLNIIANKANQPVYVHCGSASRVGGMWMIKRVLQDGWEIDKATEEAKLIGLRNPTLEQFAVAYINSHKK